MSLEKRATPETSPAQLAQQLLQKAHLREQRRRSDLYERDLGFQEKVQDGYVLRVFHWQVDDRQAQFEVLTEPDDLTEVVAIRLLQLDYDVPTPSERTDWESRLREEIRQQSATYMRLVS